MKKLVFPTLLLLCTTGLFAQTRVTQDVSTFSRISFAVSGKALVKQGSTQKVELEGDKEALEKIEVEVEGNRLVIRSKEKWYNWNWGNDDKITAYITVKEIEGLSVSGSGDMVVQGKIKTGNLDLNVSGSGSLNLEADAGDTDANVSGSGDMELKGSFASFSSDISGSGEIEINGAIAGEAEFDISGSGKAEASGTSQSVDVDVTGSGRVLAANLETGKCRVRISGSGNVEVNVKNELDAKISGSGDVRYKGSPAHVNADSSGSGSVKKM